MKQYLIAIRENATGEIRFRAHEHSDDSNAVFCWTRHNFACDCNRAMEFARAGGPGPVDDPHWNNVDLDCGDSAFSVLRIETESGWAIYTKET